MQSYITFENKLTAALIGTTLLTVALGVLTWRVVADADNAAQWVRHTNEVMDNVTVAREATIQIESMTRGYMVYGDKSMLSERDAVAKRRAQAVAELEQLTRDNPAQQARMPALKKAALDRRVLSDKLIELRDTQGFEAARAFGADALTSQTRNIYLSVLAQFDAEERRLLKLRDANQLQARENSVRLGLLTALAMLALLVAAYMMINRHANNLSRARRELEATNQALKKANELAEQAKESAEHANASKDTFMATMSHEIRTPMTGLLGMLELLAHSNLNREQADTLAVARDSGLALGRIIDDILDHAKIKAGKLSIALEPVSLPHLLQRNVNTYFAVASAKGLTLRQMVDPRISPAVMADPLRLLQVLGNLVSNAIKFTQQGYVEVRAEWLGRSETQESVQLSVKDTGIGMDTQSQARIFQPFEQGSIDTQRLYGGTGLGLAISRRLAQMMGGDIVIDSAPGVGTTMRITLALALTDAQPSGPQSSAKVAPLWQLASPQRPASSSTPTQAAVQMAQLGNPAPDNALSPLVLAVDDNPTNRLLIERQLMALGMRVETAADGGQALAKWLAGNYALVITDCNMPGMDGYALARAIRQHEVAKGSTRTPVLAWTANAMPDTLSGCQAAGMDAVLVKPAELRQLRALLVQWLPSFHGLASWQATQAGDAAVAAASEFGDLAAIDLTLLRQVAGSDPQAFQRFMATIYLAFKAQIPELSTALQSQQHQPIALAAHKLKGAAGSVGAQALMALCARVEDAARAQTAADWTSMGGQFAMEGQRVLAALQAHCAPDDIGPAVPLS